MISHFEADNFKGFREFSVELPTPIAIVAGANGSGKTSLCEAITFALDLAADRPATVVEKWFGHDDTLMGNLWDRRMRVGFGLRGRFRVEPSGEADLDWRIEIAKRRGWGVATERADRHDQSDIQELLRRKGRRIRALDRKHGDWIEEIRELPSFLATIAPEQKTRHPELWALQQALVGVMVPFLDPIALRSRSRDPDLGPTGRNFAGFLHSFRAAASFADILRQLRDVFPDVTDVQTVRDRFGWTDLRVVRSVKGYPEGAAFRAWQVNDGLLRFLALLAIPRAKRGVRLFCVEEPENGMHPKLLRHTLDALRALANAGVQIVVTTHSPVLLNWACPEEVVVLRNPGQAGPLAHRLTDLPEAMRRIEARHFDVGDVLYNLDDDRLFRRAGGRGTGRQ